MCSAMMAWFEEVRSVVGWDLADQARMAALRGCLDADLTAMIEMLGKQWSRLKGTQPLMANVRFVQRLHGVLDEWLRGLLNGTFDDEYVRGRLAFGQELAEIDLDFGEFILLEGLARMRLFDAVQRESGGCSQELCSTLCTLDKALNLDLALIYSAYLKVRNVEMERELLDHFLAITGFSRTLYQNLADAREWSSEGWLQAELT